MSSQPPTQTMEDSGVSLELEMRSTPPPTDLQREEAIVELAHKITNRSESFNYELPFESAKGGCLDPKSGHFDARTWAQAFYNLRYGRSGGKAQARVAGVAFKDLSVWGKGSRTDFQSTVGNNMLKVPAFFGRGEQRIDILRNLDGLVLPGEQLCVLGPPGSGCTTFLKTIAGETHGFKVGPETRLNYRGITADRMKTVFKGEAIYTAEVDAHFPHLSVGDTLYFAARARSPRHIPGGEDRERYAEHLRDVVMAMFGISHTVDTKVGDDFVRGISGGERKRVTIAEAALSYAPLQCWDNSTRGLDSANAVEFCRTLRTQCDVFGASTCVAIYQAPQAAYDIYFGHINEARGYFERLGFECPPSQTDPDFLTSMSSPSERRIRPGFEHTTPRTPNEFAECWRNSPERKGLLAQIEHFNQQHPIDGVHHDEFAMSRKLEKSPRQRQLSPYTLSYWSQIRLCMWREYQILKSDPSVTIAMLVMNFIEAIVVASVFYNLPKSTASFFSRGAVIFMVVLLNAFGSMLEIMALYAKRTIVEKHNRYALYRPSAEAVASMIIELPYKVMNSIIVNSTLYFMADLRREAGPFFFFLLIAFSLLLSMSMFFRWFASMTKTIEQALAPSSLILMFLILYTGFVIPVRYMLGWASWIRWINPVAYGFEAVMVNEFHDRSFPCAQFVPSGPSYQSVASDQRACAVQGSVAGAAEVSGTAFVANAYGYEYSNRWRDFGVITAFTIVLLIVHLVTTELVASARSKGEVLVFRRSKMHSRKAKQLRIDEETGGTPAVLAGKTFSDENLAVKVQQHDSIFHWEDVCYDVKIKGQSRKILDSVDGWIKPGSLTALMGVSGAGKTTLLDALASRITTGVVTGSMFVDGKVRDQSFQRNTGYVMQQDIHLSISTVRETLEFSALLRQSPEYMREERLAYVDEVIRILEMEDYADAIVGVAGSGLNVEQRKRLTIGVELAARPKLLLFLDEPTSGLDSQTSWSICNLMEKLTRNGQAILCTIHQPSSLLFQRFDRLLLLAQGGKTVYFGDIGSGSETLVDYFVRNGGPPCGPGANPAEYMLEVIGAAPGSHTSIDWPATWRASPEHDAVRAELARLRQTTEEKTSPVRTKKSHQSFAAPFTTQLRLVANRCAQQYWRTPSYVYSKMALTVGCSLILGFSFFNGINTQQGLQNQMFGVFIFLFVVIQLLFQIIPMFVVQRTLYEARERQSKTYAWQAFVLSNIMIEMFWNSIVAVFCFVVWYYPVGLYHNAEFTDSVGIRGLHTFLLIWVTFLFASSLSHMLIAGVSSDQTASAYAMVISIMLYAFCGILAGPSDLPRFWIFMYRVNPFTYLVSSLMSATLGKAPAYCADNEFQTFNGPDEQSCAEYMQPYIAMAGGYLRDPMAMGQCQFCQLDSTDMFLQKMNINWDNRWRDFGLLWVYVAFNTVAAVFLYWVARVPKGKKVKSG